MREKWSIGKDPFLINYLSAEHLLEAFRQDLVDIGNNSSDQHIHGTRLIWEILDPDMQMFPNQLGNTLALEDIYHKVTMSMIGKAGAVQAPTLRVRWCSLNYFLKFLRRRHIYAGVSLDAIQRLQLSINDWNEQLAPYIAKRKVEIRAMKTINLITPDHLFSYGRSAFIQQLVRCMLNPPAKITRQLAINARDHVMVSICIMNGLRSSNLINLEIKDVKNYTLNDDYPGHKILINDMYKTATIYGEKVIVIPDLMYDHLLFYLEKCRPLLSICISEKVFIPSTGEKVHISYIFYLV